MPNISETLATRRSTHGNFNLQAACTLELMQVLHKYAVQSDNEFKFTPVMRESLHMQCHKQARIVCGDPFLHDSWHDIAGYATLVADTLTPAQTAEVPPQPEKVNNARREPEYTSESNVNRYRDPSDPGYLHRPDRDHIRSSGLTSDSAQSGTPDQQAESAYTPRPGLRS